MSSQPLHSHDTSLSQVVRNALEFSVAQYGRLLEQLPANICYPRSWAKGKLITARPADWTSGFFPGALWYLFEASGDLKWRESAAFYTNGLESMRHNRKTHDIGFILHCSFGNGFRLTNDPRYRQILIEGADSLISRFHPVIGCIKSWDTRTEWPFPVIIDNMMNLELLLWAARETGVSRYREIAVSHADATLRNHFRPDGSSYHVVDYDPVMGRPRKKQTHQGVADESAWVRGQGWGLYGFTFMYRETKNPVYLAHAKRIAQFIIRHPRMPADKIPYWDFDAPRSPIPPRDASAAAIICSALFELSTLVPANEAPGYAAFASEQLRSLASFPYRSAAGENGGFLLGHSTGSFPRGSEVDAPLNYADYYFLEALLRCARLLKLKDQGGHHGFRAEVKALASEAEDTAIGGAGH